MRRPELLVANLADTASRVVEHIMDAHPDVLARWPDLSDIHQRLCQIETEALDWTAEGARTCRPQSAPFRYRPQRGGLAESMREVVTFNDFWELREYLRPHGEIVSVRRYGDDSRIGWDTTYIVNLLWPDGSISPVGFTDGLPSLDWR